MRQPNTSYTSTVCLLSAEYLFSLSLSLFHCLYLVGSTSGQVTGHGYTVLFSIIHMKICIGIFHLKKKHGAYHSEVTVTTLRCFYGVAMVFWVVAKALLRCSGLLDAQALFDKATLN